MPPSNLTAVFLHRFSTSLLMELWMPCPLCKKTYFLLNLFRHLVNMFPVMLKWFNHQLSVKPAFYYFSQDTRRTILLKRRVNLLLLPHLDLCHWNFTVRKSHQCYTITKLKLYQALEWRSRKVVWINLCWILFYRLSFTFHSVILWIGPEKLKLL